MPASKDIEFLRDASGVWFAYIGGVSLLQADKHDGVWRAFPTIHGHDAKRLGFEFAPIAGAIRLLCDAYDGAPWFEVRRTIRAELAAALKESGLTAAEAAERVRRENRQSSRERAEARERAAMRERAEAAVRRMRTHGA